jgi:electron transfer flavoprotein beta subunit
VNICVCLKQTFDTEEKIDIRDGIISEDGVKFVINPYDEYAVEEAVRLKERFGGEVTVITVGPARAESALRTALAMGADHAIIVDDERLFGDEHTTAKVLAAVVGSREYDLVLGGYMAVDSGSGQGGARLAELLGIANISAVTKLEIEEATVRAERDVEGDVEVIEAALPVLITAQQGLNEPRYPSLPGIMKAKRKPLQRLTAEDLGVDPEQLKAKTSTIERCVAPPKKAGRILQGEIDAQAKELARILTDDARVKMGGEAG